MTNKNTDSPEKLIEGVLTTVISKDKQASIKKEGGRTVALITLVSLVGQQITLNLDFLKEALPAVQTSVNPSGISLGELLTMWNVFMTSAPFAVGVAILYTLWKLEKIPMAFPHILMPILGVMIPAALVGNALGFTPVEVDFYRLAGNGGGVAGMTFNLFNNYLNAYGAVMILSSLFVGRFLGKTILLWKPEE